MKIFKSKDKETRVLNITDEVLRKKANKLTGELKKWNIRKSESIHELDEITTETSKETLQYYIAVATEQFEKAKAVQVTIFFFGLIFSVVFAASYKIFKDYYSVILFGIIVLLVVSAFFTEKLFTNSVGRLAKLKEILILLEKKI